MSTTLTVIPKADEPKPIPQPAENYLTMLDEMKAIQRFFFGIEYLYYSAKAKITKSNDDVEFLEAAHQKHQASKVSVPSGEIVVKQLPQSTQ